MEDKKVSMGSTKHFKSRYVRKAKLPRNSWWIIKASQSSNESIYKTSPVLKIPNGWRHSAILKIVEIRINL